MAGGRTVYAHGSCRREGWHIPWAEAAAGRSVARQPDRTDRGMPESPRGVSQARWARGTNRESWEKRPTLFWFQRE